MSSWQPTGMTAGELARMQQEAERRVEEMRRRVQQYSGGYAGETQELPEQRPEAVSPLPAEDAGEDLFTLLLLAALLRGEENRPLLLALAWLLL